MGIDEYILDRISQYQKLKNIYERHIDTWEVICKKHRGIYDTLTGTNSRCKKNLATTKAKYSYCVNKIIQLYQLKDRKRKEKLKKN